MSRIIGDVRKAVAGTAPLGSYIVSIEGSSSARAGPTTIIGLSMASLGLICLVLYTRYRSSVLAARCCDNILLTR